MSTTDSVSVFAEGTFEEQIQELVNYIVRNRSEDERAALIRPFQDALKTEEGKQPLSEDEERRRKIFSMVLAHVKGLGDGSEKEIEGFFNLLYSHLLSLYPADSPEMNGFLRELLQTLSSTPSENSAVKYRIMSNLFNALPRRSALRPVVYYALLNIALANDQLDVLKLSGSDVERWLTEWDISQEEKSIFWKTLVDAHTKTDQLGTSYQYTLSYIRSLSPSSPSYQVATIDAIATALRLPSVLEFDALFKLDAIVAVKDHELFSLLQVFLNEGLLEFYTWEQNHPSVLETFDLDRDQLERKMRLLTLSSLGFRHLGRDLSYTEIATALQIEPSQVEHWAIDVIRTGLLSGKLSQTHQTLHVMRSTARAFEREHWEMLEKRLVAWKTGLAGVLEVVAAARKRNGGAVEVPMQTYQQPQTVTA